MDSIFNKMVEIRFYDCDSKKRAKVSTINKLIADIAGIGYAAAGMTHQWLWNHGYVFLLSKVSIHFDRMPVADESITVSTWERGNKGASFLRDFEIFDETDSKIIDARTEWILVNPESRQIIRPSSFEGIRATLPEKQANAPDCKRLKFPEGSFAGERQVRYSDLDGNGHVYNAVYADIAVDMLPPALREKKLQTYQINFIHEAKLGDTLSLFTAVDGNTVTVKGCIGEKDSFVCELCYE